MSLVCTSSCQARQPGSQSEISVSPGAPLQVVPKSMKHPGTRPCRYHCFFPVSKRMECRTSYDFPKPNENPHKGAGRLWSSYLGAMLGWEYLLHLISYNIQSSWSNYIDRIWTNPKIETSVCLFFALCPCSIDSRLIWYCILRVHDTSSHGRISLWPSPQKASSIRSVRLPWDSGPKVYCFIQALLHLTSVNALQEPGKIHSGLC